MSSSDHKKPFSGSTYPAFLQLFSFPNVEEIQACWDLCRLNNNMGCWFFWLPTAWSIVMYYHSNPSVSGLECLRVALLYIPLCAGVKSLGMTIDDILDHDIDLLVERTKDRAIPRGSISIQRAWLFCFLQIFIGVYLGITYVKPRAFYISMWFWPIFYIYPTLKRWMSFAPIPLGLIFSSGVLMGWAELSSDGRLPWNILLPVYLGAVCWTVVYETVYQHQDKVDDQKIGVHSLAIYWAERTIPICAFLTVCFIALLAYGGMLNGHGIPFYFALLIAGKSLISPLLRINVDVPTECLKFFIGTPRVGQIILAGLLFDGVLGRWIRGLPL